MAEPLRFRSKAYGYDYTWEVLPPGLQVDAALRPFVLAQPVERHKGHKQGRLRGAHVFHLHSMAPETVEYFRARVMNPQTTKA
jgi:hypothetical protein